MIEKFNKFVNESKEEKFAYISDLNYNKDDMDFYFYDKKNVIGDVIKIEFTTNNPKSNIPSKGYWEALKYFATGNSEGSRYDYDSELAKTYGLLNGKNMGAGVNLVFLKSKIDKIVKTLKDDGFKVLYSEKYKK